MKPTQETYKSPAYSYSKSLDAVKCLSNGAAAAVDGFDLNDILWEFPKKMPKDECTKERPKSVVSKKSTKDKIVSKKELAQSEKLKAQYQTFLKVRDREPELYHYARCALLLEVEDILAEFKDDERTQNEKVAL